MQLTGHRTREVFERYNITNSADLEAGVLKLAAHLGKKAPAETKGTVGGQSALRVAGAAE